MAYYYKEVVTLKNEEPGLILKQSKWLLMENWRTGGNGKNKGINGGCEEFHCLVDADSLTSVGQLRWRTAVMKFVIKTSAVCVKTIKGQQWIVSF